MIRTKQSWLWLNYFHFFRAEVTTKFVVLFGTLVLAVLIRSLPVFLFSFFPPVFDPDSARFLRQTKIIVENGHLPPVDSLRYYPLGRRTSDQLTFYPYVLALLHRFFKLFYPHLTVENSTRISTPLFFGLFLLVLYFLVREIFSSQIALLTVNLTALVPSTLNPTVVGIVDRDTLCLLLFSTMSFFYLRAQKTSDRILAYFLAFLAGLTAAGLVLTWQSSGLLISILALTQMIVFLLKYEWRTFQWGFYVLWAIPIYISTLLIKPKVYSLEHAYGLIVNGIPLSVAILILSTQLISKHKMLRYWASLGGKVPLSIVILASFIIPSILILYQLGIVDRLIIRFISPFGMGRFSETISELRKHTAADWIHSIGVFLFATFIGVILFTKRICHRNHLPVWTSIALIELVLSGTIGTQFLQMKSSSSEPMIYTFIYITSILTAIFGMVIIYARRSDLSEKPEKRNGVDSEKENFGDISLFMAFWVLLFLSRSAIRFDVFFVPIALAMGSFTVITALAYLGVPKYRIDVLLVLLLAFEVISIGRHLFSTSELHWTKNSNLYFLIALFGAIGWMLWVWPSFPPTRKKVKAIGACTLVVLLLLTAGVALLPGLGGYIDTSIGNVTKMRPTLRTEAANVLRWAAEYTSPHAVIAAWWDYGSFINLLSERASIVDDEQLPYWVHLMARKVLLETDDLDALRFLKTHGATHLFLTANDLLMIEPISLLGSDASKDTLTYIMPFQPAWRDTTLPHKVKEFRYTPVNPRRTSLEPLRINDGVYPPGRWSIVAAVVKRDFVGNDARKSSQVVIEVSTPEGIVLCTPEETYENGNFYPSEKDSVLPGMLCIAGEPSNPQGWKVFYLPRRARHALLTRLCLLSEESEFLRLVTTSADVMSESHITVFKVPYAQLWEIQYPENLASHPQALAPTFPDADLERLWQEGDLFQRLK